MIAENRRSRAHIDKTLIVLVFGLALFGVLAVCIATYSTSSTSDASLLHHIVESSSAIRQCVFLFMAPFILLVITSIPYDFFRRHAELIYFGSTLLVTVVWIFNRAEGVKAWLDIIWGFTIQPS